MRGLRPTRLPLSYISSEVHGGYTRQLGDATSSFSIEKVGWGGWTRTNTVLINSEVSYQLDHAPIRKNHTTRLKTPAPPHPVPYSVFSIERIDLSEK